MKRLKTSSLRKFLILVMVITLLCIPFSFAEEGSYDLGNVEKHIIIQDNGATQIAEDVTYKISGTVNGVYRDVAISGNQSIDNISVETPGYYNTVEVINSSNNVQIKVWLYKDEAKTQKVSDEDVRIIYHYNFNKGVKIYNDIAEYQYMAWGSGWDSSVDNLTTYIQLPGSHNEVELWNNPPGDVKESTWISDNTLKTVYNPLDSGQNTEIRMLIPKSYFNSTENADVINKDAKTIIEQDQQDYENGIKFQDNMCYVLEIIFVILLFVPVGVYYKYGREPKIDYKADYESQLPTNDPVIFVNAMMSKPIGTSDLNGFQATLLDLIDKKYYKVIVGNDNDMIIKRKDKDQSSLKQYEKDIIKYLKQYEDKKGNISLKSISEGDRGEFSQFMDAWEIDVNKEVTSARVKELFDDTGDSIMNLVSLVSIIIAILGMIILFVFIDSSSQSSNVFILGVLVLIESVLILLYDSNGIMGRWTPKGKEFNDKWKNFKKYLKDYSLIKEYPPESVQVWGRYLVYATALGCADEVNKNMKKYFKEYNVSEEYYSDYDTLYFSYYGGWAIMYSSFNTLNTPETDTDPGSFGDIGDIGSGGFGGGGGGVF